ncbi:MAG TPA: prolipoprotein diacylglyceryl transferase family protein, partial [Aggregatilineales bacterium]|nr:prolipoprotein diacylglyceryl transferase family protein [Aggregatilineales bacterium]
MSVDAYGVHAGFLYIRFYALIIVIGIIAGVWVALRRARAKGLDEEHIWDGMLWAVIPGVIGARLYHVFTVTPADAIGGLSTQFYLQNPLQILAIWNGGLGIYGAIVGAGLGILAYCYRQKLRLLPWLDVIAPCAALGQAIGRWGNFVNRELYGAPSSLPWAIY